MVDNRPFREEISKISEQNLDGYVSRVEVQTKEDLKDVAEAGVSLTAPGRIYIYGKYGVDLIEDYQNNNFDRTIKNLVNVSTPSILRKAGIPKKSIGGGSDVSDLIGAGISLERNLNE
mgnify:CR=1 FL=1